MALLAEERGISIEQVRERLWRQPPAVDAPPTDPRLLRMKSVKAKIGFSQAAIYRWMHEGTFPRPLKVGGWQRLARVRHRRLGGGEGALMHTGSEASPTLRLIRLREVIHRVGLGKTAIYARIRVGEFPKPVDLGGVIAWAESEVDAWIEAKIASR